MKHHAAGMTLIELMTVLTLTAMLSIMAISSYRGYTLRANRTEGRSAILRIQVAEEKYFLQNNTYTTDIVGGLGLPSTTTASGYYTLTVAAGATGAIATSYIATATAAGTQVRDTAACTTFSVTDQGVRSPLDTTGCWK